MDELLSRVQDKGRAVYLKTRDSSLIKKRFAEEEVFYFNHPNEFTLDVTHLTPKESAEKILEYVAHL